MMNNKIILLYYSVFILLSGIFISCQKEESPTEEDDLTEIILLFEQPNISDLNNYVSKNPNELIYQVEDQMQMTSYQLHLPTSENYSYPITNWDIGEFTGVPSSTPLEKSQISISASNSRKGSTAFQASGEAVGAINSPHLFPEIIDKISGTLIFPVHPLHVTYSSNRRVRPFADNRKSLNMSLEIKMPMADGYDTDGIGYVGPNFTIRDVTTNTIFYIGTQIWDSRGVGHEGLMLDDCDKCSGNVMVPTILSEYSKYITPMDGSGYFRGSPWKEFQYFGWSITRDDFTNIIKEINEKHPDKEISDDISNYEVVSFLIGTEVVLPTKEDKFTIALSVRNFKVSISQ